MKLLLGTFFLSLSVNYSLSLPANTPSALSWVHPYNSSPLLNDVLPLQATVNINGNISIELHDNRQTCCNQQNVNHARPNLPDGYQIHFENEEYLMGIKYHSAGQNWNDARKICSREGGFLAYATSKEEEDVYLKIMDDKNTSQLWIGIHDYFTEGQFATILGEEANQVAYITWHPGQPDNTNKNENCVHYWRLMGIKAANDMPCHVMYPFNCKIKLRKN